MTIFALKKMDAIKGIQSFEKILIDGQCLIDVFEESIKNNKQKTKELATIYRYMEVIANLGTLPEKHFKDITPDGQSVKEYEFKSKHLRIYAIKKEGGKIIILGGFKNNQHSDIKKFRSIKRQYLEVQNINHHE